MTAQPLSPTASSRRTAAGGTSGDPFVRVLPGAGAAYVLSWSAGLVVAPAAPSPDAPAAEVHAYYVGHADAVLVQSLLVHGLAGVCLGVMAVGMARAFQRDVPLAGWVRGTGLAAALVSFVQVALAIIACTDPGGLRASTSAALFTSINYADTLKLVLLASFAATVTYAGSRSGVFPGWLRFLGRALPPLLVVGGLAFVVTNPVLYGALEVSLVVLLVWAAAASWVVGRRVASRAGG
jgi:hypothetical protein